MEGYLDARRPSYMVSMAMRKSWNVTVAYICLLSPSQHFCCLVGLHILPGSFPSNEDRCYYLPEDQRVFNLLWLPCRFPRMNYFYVAYNVVYLTAQLLSFGSGVYSEHGL